MFGRRGHIPRRTVGNNRVVWRLSSLSILHYGYMKKSFANKRQCPALLDYRF